MLIKERESFQEEEFLEVEGPIKDLSDLHYFIGVQAVQSLVQFQVRERCGPQVVKGIAETPGYSTSHEDVICPGPCASGT